jgi:anaerobic selenocysteine-containing dehydrogenase
MEETVVDTACPLDCPDSCSLAVTVSKGRVSKIDGSTLNPPTAGYICAKVRNFADRVYGDARLQHPAVRTGVKGQGRFSRVSWDEALELIASRLLEIRERWGGEAILPFSYGGSNGLLTQDTIDACSSGGSARRASPGPCAPHQPE